MDSWFTVEAIEEDTFAISEYKHWEETHCYLLIGHERAALIDTGLGVADIRRVVEKLTRLPVAVVTTHAHWDHIGGHGLFHNIAIHEAERNWLSGDFPLPLNVVKYNLLREPCILPADFNPESYAIYSSGTQMILRDGDRLSLGGRELTVLHTPGHSPGHCCIYEPARRTLFSGDLIYRGTLDAFYPTTDPFLFLCSLRRLQGLAIDRICPGHHRLDIPVSLLNEVEAAFSHLERVGRLFHGSGLYNFGIFQIHI